MSKYIKGDAIANATSYELHEKVGSDYNLLDTKNEINFILDELSLNGGEHILVVKAKADGYEDSDYSNEVSYTVSNSGTISPNGNAKSYVVKKDGSNMSGGDYGNLEYDLTAGQGGTINITTTYNVPGATQYADVVMWALFSGTVGVDTILTPVGPDAHDGVYTATIDMTQYPTATKLRVFGTKATMKDEVVVTYTA